MKTVHEFYFTPRFIQYQGHPIGECWIMKLRIHWALSNQETFILFERDIICQVDLKIKMFKFIFVVELFHTKM